jgi:hypothetical protein
MIVTRPGRAFPWSAPIGKSVVVPLSVSMLTEACETVKIVLEPAVRATRDPSG